jgi:hypothetical protein
VRAGGLRLIVTSLVPSALLLVDRAQGVARRVGVRGRGGRVRHDLREQGHATGVPEEREAVRMSLGLAPGTWLPGQEPVRRVDPISDAGLLIHRQVECPNESASRVT